MYSCCCYVPDNFDVVTLTKLHHVVEGCLILDCVGKNCISIDNMQNLGESKYKITAEQNN